MLAALPLPIISVAAYNLLVLVLAGSLRAADAQDRISRAMLTLRTSSGGVWLVSPGDLLLALSLAILFVELVKPAGGRRVVLVNQGLSVILFLGCVVELLLVPACASSTFFLISLMALLSAAAGFMAAAPTPRRQRILDD